MDRVRLSRELRAARESEAKLARWAGLGEMLLAGVLLIGVVLFLSKTIG